MVTFFIIDLLQTNRYKIYFERQGLWILIYLMIAGTDKISKYIIMMNFAKGNTQLKNGEARLVNPFSKKP